MKLFLIFLPILILNCTKCTKEIPRVDCSQKTTCKVTDYDFTQCPDADPIVHEKPSKHIMSVCDTADYKYQIRMMDGDYIRDCTDEKLKKFYREHPTKCNCDTELKDNDQ